MAREKQAGCLTAQPFYSRHLHRQGETRAQRERRIVNYVCLVSAFIIGYCLGTISMIAYLHAKRPLPKVAVQDLRGAAKYQARLP